MARIAAGIPFCIAERTQPMHSLHTTGVFHKAIGRYIAEASGLVMSFGGVAFEGVMKGGLGFVLDAV